VYRAVLPALACGNITPLAQVGSAYPALCAEDSVELLEREARDRIVPVNENRQVRCGPCRAESGVSDLDLERLVVMHPLERHCLHRNPHLARHEGEIRYAGIHTGERRLGAVKVVRKGDARLNLPKSRLKMLDELTVGGIPPHANRSTHFPLGAIGSQLAGHAPVGAT
jgi:hypothetical protein